MYVSLDGGNTWSSSGLHGSRAWAVAIQSGALGAETLYAGLAGSGIRVSTDEGKTWTDSSSGLPNLDVRDIAVTTGGLAAGTDDGVALSATGSTWYAGGLTGDSISAVAGIPGAPGPVFYRRGRLPQHRQELPLPAGPDQRAVDGGHRRAPQR